MSYISSNANRWYCAREDAYGQVGAITATNRIPAVTMKARHQRDKTQRKDKTGTRTWAGAPDGVRRHTTFDATSYVRDWPDPTNLPPHGPLVEAAMGAQGVLWPGATTDVGTDESTIRFVLPHGLNPGDALVSGGEIRFVAAVITPQVVIVNVPFTVAPVPGLPITSTANYSLATELPSVSLFDFWDPATAVQRVFCGGAVDRMTVSVNGDFHQLQFQGMAQDLVDSMSFATGQGGLTAFPVEPTPTAVDYSPVPGNLGQVWMGVIPNQMFTVSQASIEIRNNLNLRLNEYGSVLPRAITPGARQVLLTLEFFSQDDTATAALYQAARQHSPVSLMFQLGQIGGQLMGIYLKSMIPDVPQFDDSETRLKWQFRDTPAQGTVEDEMVVAFG
jgi:hypothetical protein